MSWIALSGRDIEWTCEDTFGATLGRPPCLADARLHGDRDTAFPYGRPQTLLGYERRHPWSGRISLQAVPGGGVVVVLNQGTSHFHTVIPPESGARTETLRLTLSWDAPARWGRLVVERPESSGFRMIETPPPPPLMLEDIFTMIHRPQLRAGRECGVLRGLEQDRACGAAADPCRQFEDHDRNRAQTRLGHSGGRSGAHIGRRSAAGRESGQAQRLRRWAPSSRCGCARPIWVSCAMFSWRRIRGW